MKNGAAQVLEYVPFGTFQLPHVVFHVVLVAQSKKSHSLGPGKLLHKQNIYKPGVPFLPSAELVSVFLRALFDVLKSRG